MRGYTKIGIHKILHILQCVIRDIDWNPMWMDMLMDIWTVSENEGERAFSFYPSIPRNPSTFEQNTPSHSQIYHVVPDDIYCG